MKRKRVADGRKLSRDSDYRFTVRACLIENMNDLVGFLVQSLSSSISSSCFGRRRPSEKVKHLL